MTESPFGFAKPKDSPGFLLWQTTMEWQRRIKRALEPYGLSHGQFVILALLLWLKENEHVPTQALIAEWSKLDKMTVSKSLKKLSSAGFIWRHELPEDTRAKSVMLSTLGNDLVYKLAPIIEAIDDELFGGVSAEERQSLIHILGKLAKN